MVTMARSITNWCNTHIFMWIARIHSHTYIYMCINTELVTTTLCEAPAHLLQNLEGTRGKGSKPEYQEKTPDSLPANQYQCYHILQEKVQRPRRELNPHPPTSSLGQEPVQRLTH